MSKESNFVEGANAAIQNARRLIACADLIAASGEFGPANSLLILSIEESAKAGFLSACAIAGEPFISDEDLGKFFKWHKNKHYFGFVTRLMSEYVSSFMNDPCVLSDIENRFKDISETDSETILKRFEEVAQKAVSAAAHNMQTALAENDSIGDRHWWQTINSDRNRGFYTDFEEGTWRTPTAILQADFERTKTTALKVLSESESYKVKTPEGAQLLRRIIVAVKASQESAIAALPDEL